ncbi:MAG: hypothetical protein IPG45_09075 [Deltaproteobacteria bacterium]|nr:hypothetical protein [Deltaproteobacteria bacterium]
MIPVLYTWWLLGAPVPVLEVDLRALPPLATATVADDPEPRSPLLSLPVCTLPPREVVRAFLRRAPGANSDRYREPEPLGLLALRSLVVELGNAAAARALGQARIAGYLLCRSEEWAPVIVALPNAADGRAPLLFRPGPARPLVVQAPHPFFEAGTLDEAEALFERLNARAMLVAGAHRCASTGRLACSGSTSVCDKRPGPFRASDAGHAPASTFQVLHEALSDLYPEAWSLSLHGMTGTGIIVSNGSSGQVGPDSPVALLAEALKVGYPDQPIATCNEYAGGEIETLLCGTTNAQGRYLNEVDDVCAELATRSTDRFLHLEQSVAARAHPEPLYQALDLVVPLR